MQPDETPKQVQARASVHSLAERRRGTDAGLAGPVPRPRLRADQSLHPLERVCTLAGADDAAFARRAQALLQACPQLRVTPTGGGLLLAAETEEVMDSALATLAAACGAPLRAGPPTVRLCRRASLEEPWMSLRVQVPVPLAAAVQRELRHRAARLAASDPGEDGTLVLRATLPLTKALGFGAALARLTRGAGRHESWLSHYEPVGPFPPGGDAA